jgi:hypothetical protein
VTAPTEAPAESTTVRTTFAVEFLAHGVWRDWSGQPREGVPTRQQAEANEQVCARLGLPTRIVTVERTITERRLP